MTFTQLNDVLKISLLQLNHNTCTCLINIPTVYKWEFITFCIKQMKCKIFFSLQRKKSTQEIKKKAKIHSLPILSKPQERLEAVEYKFSEH